MKTATKTRRYKMLERIEKHGLQLLAIFPNATERDPDKLCRKLRRLEREGEAIGLQLCNGPQMSDAEQDRRVDAVLAKVDKLLCFTRSAVPVFVNLDPRGYALKIDDEWMRCLPRVELHTDMGGYGIIAPDLSEHD